MSLLCLFGGRTTVADIVEQMKFGRERLIDNICDRGAASEQELRLIVPTQDHSHRLGLRPSA